MHIQIVADALLAPNPIYDDIVASQLRAPWWERFWWHLRAWLGV